MKRSIHFYSIGMLYIVFLLTFAITAGVAQGDCAAGEWLIDGACSTADAELSNGWHTITTGGETRCAHDTDYRIWVRPGNEHVVLYFQGGGGCWNEDTCRQGSTFYKQSAGLNEAAGYRNGIFDFDNPDNPFSDSTFVFAPSCTGDVYMGSDVSSYSDDVVVHHHGFDNLMAVVNFTIDYAPEPESVFVAGCSAGSVGSAIAVPFIIDAYPDTRVTQLGDSLGTIFDTATDLSSLWGVPDFYTEALSEFAPDLSEFSTTDYYIAMAQAYPNYTFAQFNYQFDRVQQRYFAAGVDDPADLIAEALDTSLNAISEEVSNFRYFLADDSRHCILPAANFYQLATDDVSALDWITDIAQNDTVSSVIDN
ncbi:MAG: pectin acetylesterase-family hydrolase [Aggregatilineales bacterium]